jgi:LytS/YehU family sensor histidine kinase
MQFHPFLMQRFFLVLIQATDSLTAVSDKLTSSNDVSLALLLGLLPVVLAFSFIIFVIYRSRREADVRRKETEMRLEKAEGELKALKAQINPHFIFNCLNSIHHFIQSQEPQQASDYLIKFSKLIRYVLESSAKNWVSLEEELEANELYLQLEQLRTKHAFSFEFSSGEDISLSNTFVPPMLIQPFLENAVWHGMSQEGKINLHFERNGGTSLICKISDQGNSAMSKPEYDLSNLVKKSSMGINLMEERFRNLREYRSKDAGYEFTENPNGGRTVTLKIPFEEE